MEAVVLHPHIMTDVNCNSNSLNAELEVKKLQELVRKLEKQNEQLRTRANGCTSSHSPHMLSPSPAYIFGSTGGYTLPSPLPTLLLCQSSLGSFCSTDEPFEYFNSLCDADSAVVLDNEVDGDDEFTVMDEVEVLDLDASFANEDSEDSWLYAPSKASVRATSPMTTLQWCRHVLDRPKSEVEVARRSLSLRLDQVGPVQTGAPTSGFHGNSLYIKGNAFPDASFLGFLLTVSRWRSSLSSPSSPVAGRVAGVSPLSVSSTRSSSTPQPSLRHASFTSPLQPFLQPNLSPIGKDPSALTERAPTFVPHPAQRSHGLLSPALSHHQSMDSDDLDGSEPGDDSICRGYKLQDLTDVQVMARLQEESLRQDYATSATSVSSSAGNRRSASFSFLFGQRSAPAHLLDEEDDDEDYGLLPPPQPRLTRLPHSHTFSSLRDWRRSTPSLCTPPTTPATSPYPPAGFSFQPLSQHQPPTQGCPYATDQQGFRPGSDKLRRSLTNLFRAPSMPCVPSPANPLNTPSPLRNSQSFNSSSDLARLQCAIPNPGQLQNRVRSVGNFQTLSRQPLKATAYVSPTIKGSVAMTMSTSLQTLSSCTSNSGIPLPSKPATNTPPRSSLPRPTSFVGTPSSTPRSKVAQPVRSFLIPPKSLSTLSPLRDGSWRDGCY